MQQYLPTTNYISEWRKLTLPELQEQDAFRAVLAYLKDKGGLVPTYGTAEAPDGSTIVTMKFTSPDGSNSFELWAGDVAVSPWPALMDLRRKGIASGSLMAYEPFTYTAPEPAKQPPPAGPLVLPTYVVGSTFDGVHYQNLGPIPYPGAETTDSRGTFVAAAHTYPFGTTFDWTLKVAAPVAPVQAPTTDQAQMFQMFMKFMAMFKQ